MVVCSRCHLASAVLQLSQLNKLLHLSVVVCSRCNLASVVLQLLGLNITRVLTFDFIDPPSEDVSSAFPFFLSGCIELRMRGLLYTLCSVETAVIIDYKGNQ